MADMTLQDRNEIAYLASAVAHPATLDDWPLAAGDVRHPLRAQILEAVREVRKARFRVTVPGILRHLEQVGGVRVAEQAAELLESGALVVEHDLEPVVHSLRESGACFRAQCVAADIQRSAAQGRWTETQKHLAKAAEVRSDGIQPVRIWTVAEAMRKALAPGESRLGRVIPIERQLDPIIKLEPKLRLVLGMATNVGKTSVMARWLDNASKHAASALITVEDPVEQLGAKWLSTRAVVNSADIRDGTLTAEQQERALAAIESAADHRLWIVHVEDRKLDTVLASMRALAALGVKLCGIDFLQAIKLSLAAARAIRDKREKLEHAYDEILAAGSQLDLALIISSQFSRPQRRGVRKPPPPSLNDLKESGDIENNASFVVLGHREREDSLAPIFLRVAKVKNGVGIGKRMALIRDDHGALVEYDLTRKTDGGRQAEKATGGDDWS